MSYVSISPLRHINSDLTPRYFFPQMSIMRGVSMRVLPSRFLFCTYTCKIWNGQAILFYDGSIWSPIHAINKSSCDWHSKTTPDLTFAIYSHSYVGTVNYKETIIDNKINEIWIRQNKQNNKWQPKKSFTRESHEIIHTLTRHITKRQ